MNKRYPPLDFRQIYDLFDVPIADFDCGARCSPHNPNGKPFCCDICHAVPAVYQQEWKYLRRNTDLWHVWSGDECVENPEDPAGLLADTPSTMLLLACQGPERCQRPYRALSCRQFPFFPYITSGGRWIGLAYEWAFEETCWVVSHLGQVSDAYRQEFIRTYAGLFEQWPLEYDGYALQSAELRAHCRAQKRRAPILHHNGGYHLLSPASERLQRVSPEHLPRFGPYR